MTAVTVMVSVAVSVPPLRSLMVYGKLTLPLKLAFGVKVMTPAVSTLIIPLSTVMSLAVPSTGIDSPLIEVILNVSPSISLSPLSGVKMTEPSSTTV